MNNQISETIDAYINRVLPQATKELKYIKDNDWSETVNVRSRENAYSIQKLLVDRNTKTAVKLYKMAMATDDLESKRVKSSLKVLISFYNILNKRYKETIDRFDWTSFDLEDDDEAAKAKNEVKFQAGVLDDVNSLEAQLTSINFGDESDAITIEMHGNTPLPFMMAEALTKKFPEIEHFLEKQAKK